MRARDNPFRAERVQRLRYRLDLPWPAFVERWTSLGRRGAIVGPEGAGKTTLLEGFAEVLRARGETVQWVRLSEEAREMPAVEPGAVLLLDGAEQLDAARWRLVRGQAASGVATSHRPGLWPTLWECRTSPELLDALLGDLGASQWRAEARALFDARKGNLREVLRALYDRCADQ
jgi:ATPase subunit of ABC transporter with duplicated ATPase domains